MSPFELDSRISRRQALALGGGLTATGLLATAPVGLAEAPRGSIRGQSGTLPADRIQEIVQAQGTVTDGVLSIDISRTDIGDAAGPMGVTFTPSFEIDGTLTFQPLGDNLAFFNGDLPLKPEETNGFIDAVQRNGLIFQAFHQHYIEMDPQVWFIHWRGAGAPLELAAAIRNVLAATSTPLPQTTPVNPTTPLDPGRLAKILDGDAQVGEEGVVTVNVSRPPVVIDDIRVSPEANISTGIEFKPLGGSEAWAGPDFSLTGPEVQPVVRLMRQLGWFVGCLYNQETQEMPQLFFSHMLKRGDAYELAHQIRRGLDLTTG